MITLIIRVQAEKGITRLCFTARKGNKEAEAVQPEITFKEEYLTIKEPGVLEWNWPEVDGALPSELESALRGVIIAFAYVKSKMDDWDKKVRLELHIPRVAFMKVLNPKTEIRSKHAPLYHKIRAGKRQLPATAFITP